MQRVHVTLAMMLQSCGPSCVSDSRLPMALLMVWMSSDDSICLTRICNGETRVSLMTIDHFNVNLANGEI